MLIRIALIVALLAGLGVAAVSHFMVAEKITTITNERNDAQTQAQTAQQNATAATAKAKKATEDLRITNNKLATATSDLAVMTAEASRQRQRADETAANLESTARERNETVQELAAWRATQLKPEQIKEMVADLKRVSLERAVFADEKEILLSHNAKIQAKLDLYEDPDKPVVMREGLKGKVVAVDPKWDFVVLDVGAEQGAVERGQMLVNRDGKLVAKVRLTSVQQNRSIANILPEWRTGDIMEGDQVLY